MLLLCIQTGSKIDDQNRMRYDARQFYLNRRQQMEELFKEAPESITNTFAVAEMCELKLPFGENNYPVFTLPPEIKTTVADNVEYLKNLCIEGLKERYDEDLPTSRMSVERIRMKSKRIERAHRL